MLKFSFRRERDKDFKHIAHGLIPAASIAPKPAVPRTPPPHSPNPSPERPRSALAAAILSSSLTGQTWAIPPVRPRSFSESGQSESFISEPNISTALYTRDRWSEDLANRPRLSSPEHSEEELEDREEELENEEDREEHVYQTLDGREISSIAEQVYAVPLKPKASAPQPNQMSGGRVPSPDYTEENSIQSPEASCQSSKKKSSIRKSPGSQKKIVPPRSTLPTLTTDYSSQSSEAKNPKHSTQLSPEPSKVYNEVQREVVRPLPERNPRMVDEEKLLEERLRRLEQEISHSQTSSNLRSSAGSQAELQNLRQHAQELVDENDALKLTVHRLNVELSRYQTCFRPLSKQEEEVKRLRVRVEEVIKENERLHDEIAKIGGISQKDCHQLQQQAFLVLQENQVLIDQLEAQHVKAKASHSKHHSEVSKVSKQLMLLEAEKQRLEEDLEESRRELQKNIREVQVLQARLKDAITWDEHCNIAGKLRRQLEQQESRNKGEMDGFLLRLSSLQEENRSLALDKANLTADLKRVETELDIKKQANRLRFFKRKKQGFVSRMLNGTVRFGKLQEEVKVYRRQASTRLAVLEEAAEGRTASYQREILHLQRLLRERQEAEERLLQSKREVEEELEVVWQAATRENQQIKETLLDAKITANHHIRAVSGSASPGWHSQNADEDTTSTQHKPHSPELQRRATFKSVLDHQNSSLDEKHKYGLDYYC
ncbi:Centrosomal protein of 89 kDa [Larimichthys crocea]|uniref:Uncharacterized protein n=1 Tax=Larimichthys crocea TaxID=215358 RepID=A0ACD3R0S3_LARCR|nr:Centrosomal protein of 89 kDa [Larimichthys crocea]